MKPDIIVICDFDGTLTEEDIGNAIMERFAPAEWMEWEKRWRAGELPTKENMEAQLNLISAPVSELLDWIQKQPLRSGAGEFIQECRRRAVPFHLVSDGLDFYIDPILEANGLSALKYCANSARQLETGKWRIDTPYSSTTCPRHGCCKCRLINELDPEHKAMRVYIGDSYSDLCPSRMADTVFARDLLAKHCRETGMDFKPFDTFGDVMKQLWD